MKQNRATTTPYVCIYVRRCMYVCTYVDHDDAAAAAADDDGRKNTTTPTSLISSYRLTFLPTDLPTSYLQVGRQVCQVGGWSWSRATVGRQVGRQVLTMVHC